MIHSLPISILVDALLLNMKLGKPSGLGVGLGENKWPVSSKISTIKVGARGSLEALRLYK